MKIGLSVTFGLKPRAAWKTIKERMAQDLDAALDVLAALLRAIERFPIPLPEEGGGDPTTDSAKWAEHVLLLSAPPGAAQPTKQRDFAGLRRFLTSLRQRESEHVTRAHQGLRESITEFAKTLSKFFTDNQKSDEQVKMQLERLREAAAHEDPAVLRKEMMAAVTAIGHVIEERRTTHVTAMAMLGEKVRDLNVELESVKRDAAIDPLTKLPDRRVFDEEVHRVSQVDAMLGRVACLLMIDVDAFKAINDTHGHGVGDQVLKQVADSLARTFIRRGDCVTRFGGDEFGVVLRDTAVTDAHMLAERCRQRLKEKATVPVTISIGIAEISQGETGASWFQRADRALYQAKDGGRDRVADAPGVAK